MEFERKFKLTKEGINIDTTSFRCIGIKEIAQYYLADRECDLRVRVTRLEGQSNLDYTLTLKSLTKGITREEHNINLFPDEGRRLVNSSMVKSFIEKQRTSWIPDTKVKPHQIDVDIFKEDLRIKDPITGERLEGLVEIEFPSGSLAESFIPYHWLGEEVTNDLRYRNHNLALKIN